MGNLALFSINDDLNNQGFDGTGGQALNFKLRSTVGVRTAQLQVFDAAGYDPTLSLFANPPRSSPNATELVLNNGAGGTGQSVTFATASAAVTTTLPSEVSAWIVRCTVNGGTRIVNGVAVLDPNLIHERMVVVRSVAGLRVVAVTETRQYSDDGLAAAIRDIVTAIDTVAAVPDWKSSVVAATAAVLPSYTRTGNVLTATANGAMAAVDGYSLAVGERFLLKNGADARDNGIYTVTSLGSGASPWVATRATDADTSAEVTSGMRVPVTAGATFGSRVFRLATADPITLNTTSLVFSLDSGLPAGGATTDTIQWDGSNWVATSNPTVVTATATSYFAVGSPLPSVGALRVSNNTVAVASRTTGGVDLALIYASSGDVVIVGDPDAASILIDNPLVTLSETASVPKLRQNTRTTDAAPQSLTISPQAPFASATGANRTPGSLIVDVAAPVGGSTTEGVVRIARAGTRYAELAPYPGASSFGVLWLGSAAPDVTNFVFQGNGTNQALVNAPSGALLGLTIGGVLTNGFFVRSTSLAWAESSARTIQQDGRSSDAATFNFTIKGQNAFASATGTNRNAGHVILAGGNKATGGTDGRVQFYAGATFVADIRELSGLSALVFSSAATGAVAVYDPSSDVAPQKLNLSAANAWASASTNINGAAVEITPGARKSGSAGLSGPFQVILNFTETMIEAAEVASGRRVVALNRMANLTTTEMPANSGDGVIYVANAATNPTANPVSGGILYSDAGAGKWRGTGGTVTTFGPAEPHCPRCGRDYALEWENETRGEHFAICVPCLSSALKRAGVAPEEYAITHQLAA